MCVLNPNFIWVLQSYDGFYIVNKHWKLWKRFRFRFLYEHDWRGLIYHSQSSDCLSYKNKLIYNNLHGRTSLCLNGLCPRTPWTGLSMIHFSSVVQTAVIMNNYISLLFFFSIIPRFPGDVDCFVLNCNNNSQQSEICGTSTSAAHCVLLTGLQHAERIRFVWAVVIAGDKPNKSSEL